MFVRRVDRTLTFRLTTTLALACILARLVRSYVLPDPTFEVLKPQGLRVSIPDAPGLRLFGFHANLNKAIRANEHGEITGDAYAARDGRWTVENSDVTIANGDTLHYWIYAQADGGNSRKNDQRWTYSSVGDQDIDQVASQMGTDEEDATTETTGRLLLEDNFNFLNESLWKREIKMPLEPDYEFCVYHNDNHPQLVRLNKGRLIIKPILLEDNYGENATTYGRIQLSGCTSTVDIECSRKAMSFSILPPVISARFTTREQFALQYGKIEIRAKFPEGDWLYPEMWLEPRYSMYGSNYASGRVLLGLARGNENLVNASDVSKIYDTRRLDFGIKLGASPNVREILVSKVHEHGTQWTRNFHTYTTIWTSDGFTFLVDGEEVGRVTPDGKGWLTGSNADRKAAPFDQETTSTYCTGVPPLRS
ncbi:beta-1,3-glucan-binding protein-like isoform X2 [Pseudomyrmex gracilis]|uniref:beta-1,3-glucan-binding protein-like isoform X2 n=1 Tax=Pseudomyrmex gracilis TaxID=219809 RepID=UPI0009956342|nr:beta-1,3-glucan-binding protein-like isoform X2 [Pseudomyrmex gracilis]